MKGKIIDFEHIKASGKMKSRKTVVKGPGAASGQLPQAIEVSEEQLENILKPHFYLDTEVIDAALSLLDRKLSEDAGYVEGVKVYSSTDLRLILTGAQELVKAGPFIAIFPRRFAIEEETEQAEALGRGLVRPDVSVGHFTLVSDIHCAEGEVNVYETYKPYRRKGSLLTSEQKKLLKTLKNCKDKSLQVHCVNVVEQSESECGAISIALAVKLCFSAEDEKAVFERLIDVRKDFVTSLRANDLIDFHSRKSDEFDAKERLFSIKI